jgi:hypothetical protein
MREWLNSVRLRVQALIRGQAQDQDLPDEIAHHLALREAQLKTQSCREMDPRSLEMMGTPAP